MKIDDNDNRSLDELLRRSYEPLARNTAEQRQAVLAGFSLARPQGRAIAARRRVWPARLAWLAAASIVVAIGVKTLLIPSSTDRVYGLDAAGRRLCEVKTIRVIGARYERPDRNPGAAPIRVPIEILIKRPDKFSHTWSGTSEHADLFEVRTGKRACDGRQQILVADADKQYIIGPVNPIDARLTTEEFSQSYLRFAILGQPEAPYKKIGSETISGRACDVYEARLHDEEMESTTLIKLWFDPASGFPVRGTIDEVRSDGTTVRDTEYDEISVDVPLADELFTPAAPADYKVLGGTANPSDKPVPLSVVPTGSGCGFDQSISAWHALRISDNVALVTWRRSVPKPSADGSRDWLSQMEIRLEEPKSAARHMWLYKSDSPDVWNWSLVSAVDHQLPDPGIFVFQMRTERFVGTLGMCALRLPDDQLEAIIQAAAAAALPEGVPRFTLAELRKKALELAKQKKTD